MREPRPGEVLVRNTWTSVDPGLRLRLAESGPAGYFAAFALRSAMDGIMTVGEVIESRSDEFSAGDTVSHAAGWRDYAVVAAGAPALGGLGTLTRLDIALAPAQRYLGPLGGMGLTAYAGLFDVAGLREGDVVWVSAAAGAVGSLAAQFAKLRGHRVIGSAGSDEKVAYLLDELGLDAAFNHRSGPVGELLRAAAPEGIDVYFDCVGGDHLEAALGALRRGGRVALCGAVSQYGQPRARAGQPVPGDGQRPDAARVPRQQLPAPDGRHGARTSARWLPTGGSAAARRSSRARARAGGARADAGRRHDRQDARADRLIRRRRRRPCAVAHRRSPRRRRAPRRSRARPCAARARRRSRERCRRPGTSALQSRATRSPTTMTVSAGTRLGGPGHRVRQHRAVVVEAVERRERAHLERRAAQAREQLNAALRGQRGAEGGAGRRDRDASRSRRWTPSSTALAHGHQPNPSSTTSRLRPLRRRARWRRRTQARARCRAGPAAARSLPIASTTSSKPARSSAPHRRAEVELDRARGACE